MTAKKATPKSKPAAKPVTSRTATADPATTNEPKAGRYAAPMPRQGNGVSGEETTSLPRSLIAALPTSTVVMHHVNQIKALIPALEKELEIARLSGAVTLARAYVVLHKMAEAMQDRLQISDSGKAFGPVIQKYKTVELPAVFEQEGVPHVSLDEGYRVGVSMVFRASIVSDQKLAAYQWLRDNNLADIITTTVNASTLSAAAKAEIEERNVEFPSDLFKIATLPTVSVTGTK